MTRSYLRGLAIVSLAAWLSMAVQIELLIGSHGLLPLAPLLDEARRQQLGFSQLPTLFWLSASDRMLVVVAALGAAASLFGVLRPGRAWVALSLPLYLSVSVGAEDFCSFQWDILLVEASFLALFLDVERPSRIAQWMPRLLLVKLYVESGIAKLLSPIGDWISGSAMVSYFETAPIPAPLARYAHALPVGVLHGVSWLVLVVELVVPLFVFGPRVLRRLALVVLTLFQIANALTANYGFFVPLTLVLHVSLLDLDEDRATRLSRGIATAVLCAWTALSLLEANANLGRAELFTSLRRLYVPFRVIGTYHLFASVTTERIEPIFEVSDDGEHFTELALRWKPGPIDRAPPFVAPHQPRVDFQLWFHGLRPRGRLPDYAVRLETLLCDDPAHVQPLFTTMLPAHPSAVKIRYARYRFTRPGEPTPWRREPVFERPAHPCDGSAAESARK